MSFFEVEQATTRLNRSELAVPGSSPEFFEKAAKSEADVIFLDRYYLFLLRLILKLLYL